MAALVGIATSQGLRFELGSHATVGRGAASTIVLADPLVSSVHAELRRDPAGRYRIVDLDATHGTFVNGTKVEDRVLTHGDEIIVGATRLRFEDEPRPITAANANTTAGTPFPPAAAFDLPSEPGRDYDRLRLAFEIARAVTERRDVDAILREVLDRVVAVMPAERGAVLVRDRGTGRLVPRVARRRNGGPAGEAMIPRAILDQVETHRVGILAIDASVDDRFATTSVLDGSVRSALAVPMEHDAELVGVIYLDAPAAGVFADKDLEVMATVGALAALAVRATRLRELDPPGALAPRRGRGEAILVVDPDPGMRAVIAAMIERAGFTVESAADGEAALAAAGRPELRAIVVDLGLGGITARQLGERARGLRPDLRVLYVAAGAEPGEVDEVTAQGAGFLAEPFTAAELVARLEATLSARGAEHDAGRRRIELSAAFADGAAFLAGYDPATASFVIRRRGVLPVGRRVILTVRLEAVEREFRVHGSVGGPAPGGVRVVFDADDAARDLLLSCARGESIPYFRRAHPRYPARLEVRLVTPTLVICSHSQDVSARGLMLSTDHRFEAGTLVALRVAFPGRPEPLEVAGRVQSCVAAGPRRGIGIEFQFSSQEQRDEVAERVAKLAP
jgi:CheY-like chemotaxis protein/Tfp pilus assembly protein PilZ